MKVNREFRKNFISIGIGLLTKITFFLVFSWISNVMPGFFASEACLVALGGACMTHWEGMYNSQREDSVINYRYVACSLSTLILLIVLIQKIGLLVYKLIEKYVND